MTQDTENKGKELRPTEILKDRVPGLKREQLLRWTKAGFVKAELRIIGQKPTYVYRESEIERIRQMHELVKEGYAPRRAYEKLTAIKLTGRYQDETVMFGPIYTDAQTELLHALIQICRNQQMSEEQINRLLEPLSLKFPEAVIRTRGSIHMERSESKHKNVSAKVKFPKFAE